MVDQDQATIYTVNVLMRYLKKEKTLHEELMEGFRKEQEELTNEEE